MYLFEKAIVDIVWNNNIVSKKLNFVKIDLNENRLVGNDFYGLPIEVSLENVLDVEDTSNVNFQHRNRKNETSRNRKVQQKKPRKRVQRKPVRIYK